MQQNIHITGAATNAVVRYLIKADQPGQQEMLNNIVEEILGAGQNLNRKSICNKLLGRLELASSPEEQSRYHTLIGLLFDN